MEVRKNGTWQREKVHKTEQEAEAHLEALKANVREGKKPKGYG